MKDDKNSGADKIVGSSDELERCPFCGLPASFREPEHGTAWGHWVMKVSCSSSHCGAAVQLPYDYPEVHTRLAEMWNRRANDGV